MCFSAVGYLQIQDYGVFVSLDDLDGQWGLLHKSQLTQGPTPSTMKVGTPAHSISLPYVRASSSYCFRLCMSSMEAVLCHSCGPMI